MRKALSAFIRTGLVAVLATAFVACAGEDGDINLVQPDYVKKSDLLGKSFYYRRTVVDAPENLGPYATVGTGDLFTIERLRFEIEAELLIGYRDYEYVPGSEEGLYDGTTNADYHGSPVVAFPISHFDISKRYNAETGETSRVIEENTSDREWFERDYIRVNWAQTQLIGNDMFILPVDFLDTDNVPGSLWYTHENDATSPNRARIEPDKGYVDFVTNHIIVPDVATCYFDFDFSIYDAYGCGQGEIRVRHAFMEVDELENKHYEPLNYPDTVVLHDDQGNEIRDPATGEVMREPVFDRFGYYRLEKLTYDDLRDLTESGRLNNIIRFNLWEKGLDDNGSIIPYAERTPKPIVYHLNWDFPPELLPTAFEVAEEWNDVFKDTVASLMGRTMAQTPDMYVLRENACNVSNVNMYLSAHPDVNAQVKELVPGELTRQNLLKTCSATEYFSKDLDDRFLWAQMGDPRFNMMYWIPNIVPAAFSGYGPMLGDPISGRNVVSTAYILGWTIDSAATRALEYIDYMNDELSLTDLMAGSNVPNFFFNGDYDPKASTWSVDGTQASAKHSMSDEYMQDLESRFEMMGNSFDEMMTPLDNSDHYQERLNRVAGTQLEREFLMRPEDLMLASRGNWQPGMDVSDELLDQASFVRRVRDIEAKQAYTNRFLQERTMCPHADLDGALVGLAKRLKDRPRDERRQELRKAIFKAVMLHEVGHNVGLRHNFEASYDALNYNPKFWELEETLQGDEAAKLDASQPEYKYSSIMDYHGKVNGDFQGLGLYDRAAIKFGYGQIIETFTNPALTGGKDLKQFRRDNDYKKLSTRLQGRGNMYDRTDEIFDWRSTDLTATKVNALLDREVPYLFCSDEYAGYTPTCKRFDFGANQREVQQANYVRYKNYFIFTNFLRNRLVLDFNRAVTRGYAIFRDTIMTYQYMYLYRAKDEMFFETDLGKDMATSVADGLNLLSEVIAMPTPSTYYRCENPMDADDVTYYTFGYLEYDPVADPVNAEGPEGEICDVTQKIDLGLGEAYPMFFGFSEEWYTWTFTYLGTYWDKLFALQELTDPAAYFFRENMDEDFRSYSVSLYRIYNQEVNDVLLNLIEYDRKGVAAGWDELEQTVIPKRMIDANVNATPPPKIVPALTRNLQLYSLLYGMAFLTSPLDETLDFARHTRVVLKGSADDFLDTSNVTDIVECQLPEAATAYRAHRTTSETSDIDVAFNFVNKCSQAVDDRMVALNDMQAAKDLLDNTLDTDPSYDTVRRDYDDKLDEYELKDAELRETEQVLLYMHDLAKIFEFGIGY